MTLTNVFPWIRRAFREGWAVGAFNAVNMEQAQAIAWAAEAERAPAIIQVSHRALQYAGEGSAERGLRMLAAVGKAAAENADAPISLHLDHGTQSEIYLALELGFTSVMFDADGLSLVENIFITHRLAQRAHSHAACMEAEVGDVPKPEKEEAVDARKGLTRPQDAAAFAEAAGIDTLAVAVGSIHAGKSKTTALDLGLLAAIHALVNLPLVLHGSSGVTDASLHPGIALGLAKVNVATQLSQGFTAAVRQTLANAPAEVDLRPYLGAGRSAMAVVVRERMRTFGASGKI